jgi:hypothetical protein
MLARLGPLPPDALPTLCEAGRAVVELEQLGRELEGARQCENQREANRIRRAQFALREQLGRLEERLEEKATKANHRGDLAQAFARRRAR